jgi:hypothetical protein
MKLVLFLNKKGIKRNVNGYIALQTSDDFNKTVIN